MMRCGCFDNTLCFEPVRATIVFSIKVSSYRAGGLVRDKLDLSRCWLIKLYGCALSFRINDFVASGQRNLVEIVLFELLQAVIGRLDIKVIFLVKGVCRRFSAPVEMVDGTGRLSSVKIGEEFT